MPELRRSYACFNTLLDLECPRADDLLMFDKARYGRNDTVGSQRCHVPYDSTCEIDVQHSLNAVCGGRTRCSLAINTALFDDPCGYNEFLYVNYRCLPGTFPLGLTTHLKTSMGHPGAILKIWKRTRCPFPSYKRTNRHRLCLERVVSEIMCIVKRCA